MKAVASLFDSFTRASAPLEPAYLVDKRHLILRAGI